VVRLPAAEGPALVPDVPAAVHPAAPRSARILVVDDNRDALEMLTRLLQDADHVVCSAADGHAALRSLDEFQPEIALLDIGLPGMDGYELAARLRSDPRCSATRLVAITGYGQAHDRARALETDFDEHLVKPVAAEQLFGVIERLLRASSRFGT
jgi:CheY-like chemotaxis protein